MAATSAGSKSENNQEQCQAFCQAIKKLFTRAISRSFRPRIFYGWEGTVKLMAGGKVFGGAFEFNREFGANHLFDFAAHAAGIEHLRDGNGAHRLDGQARFADAGENGAAAICDEGVRNDGAPACFADADGDAFFWFGARRSE